MSHWVVGPKDAGQTSCTASGSSGNLLPIVRHELTGPAPIETQG